MHLKAVILGAPNVGKSQIFRLLGTGQPFDPFYRPTSSVDVSGLRSTSPTGEVVTVQLWDVPGTQLVRAAATAQAGGPRDTSLHNVLYGAHVAVLVCDLTSQASLARLKAIVQYFVNMNVTTSTRLTGKGNKTNTNNNPGLPGNHTPLSTPLSDNKGNMTLSGSGDLTSLSSPSSSIKPSPYPTPRGGNSSTFSNSGPSFNASTPSSSSHASTAAPAGDTRQNSTTDETTNNYNLPSPRPNSGNRSNNSNSTASIPDPPMFRSSPTRSRHQTHEPLPCRLILLINKAETSLRKSQEVFPPEVSSFCLMYGITTVLECSAALHTNIDYLRKVIITQGSEIETIRLNVAVDPYTWRSEAEAVRRRRKDAIKAHEQVEEMIKAREEAVAKERERIQKEQERIARIRAKRRQTGDVAARQREALEKSWGVTPLVRRVASKVTLDLESCGRFYKLFRGLETITLTTFKSILHWLGHPAWAGDVVSARIVAALGGGLAPEASFHLMTSIVASSSNSPSSLLSPSHRPSSASHSPSSSPLPQSSPSSSPSSSTSINTSSLSQPWPFVSQTGPLGPSSLFTTPPIPRERQPATEPSLTYPALIWFFDTICHGTPEQRAELVWATLEDPAAPERKGTTNVDEIVRVVTSFVGYFPAFQALFLLFPEISPQELRKRMYPALKKAVRGLVSRIGKRFSFTVSKRDFTQAVISDPSILSLWTLSPTCIKPVTSSDASASDVLPWWRNSQAPSAPLFDSYLSFNGNYDSSYTQSNPVDGYTPSNQHPTPSLPVSREAKEKDSNSKSGGGKGGEGLSVSESSVRRRSSASPVDASSIHGGGYSGPRPKSGLTVTPNNDHPLPSPHHAPSESIELTEELAQQLRETAILAATGRSPDHIMEQLLSQQNEELTQEEIEFLEQDTVIQYQNMLQAPKANGGASGNYNTNNNIGGIGSSVRVSTPNNITSPSNSSRNNNNNTPSSNGSTTPAGSSATRHASTGKPINNRRSSGGIPPVSTSGRPVVVDALSSPT